MPHFRYGNEHGTMSPVTDRESTKLAEVLAEKGVAKRELARRLLPAGADRKAIDNKRSQINRWANGSVTMSEESAYAVAAALDVPPDTFATRRRGREGRAALETRLADVEGRLGKVEAATAGRLRAIEKLLRRLAEAGVIPEP